MTRDSLLSELRDVERVLDSISPKASTYAKLKGRERELQDKLAFTKHE